MGAAGFEPRRLALWPATGILFRLAPPAMIMPDDDSLLARWALPVLLLKDHGDATPPSEPTRLGARLTGSSALASRKC